jgi:hypothetical protein
MKRRSHFSELQFKKYPLGKYISEKPVEAIK